MTNLPITSREYKLMLDAGRFEDRAGGAAAMWTLVAHLVTQQGGAIDEKQDEEDERLTWYLDTPALALHQRGYSLRIRKEKNYQVTLKFRGADRYEAAAHSVDATVKGKPKFEEDVMPEQSKFARSNSVKVDDVPSLTTIDQAVALFPGLQALGITPATPLQIVNGFTAREVVRKLGKFKFESEPLVKASLSFWYLPEVPLSIPLAAEFSFDYDMPGEVEEEELERYPLTVVTGANQLFRALQRHNVWLDHSGTTKTDFAYTG